VTAITFSLDSKHLLIQTGAPDWVIHYWSWEKAKVMASLKLVVQSALQIHEVSFNPFDATLICVTGNGIFKTFRYGDNLLKPVSFKAEVKVCHLELFIDRYPVIELFVSYMAERVQDHRRY
jgi:hypothetical protein